MRVRRVFWVSHLFAEKQWRKRQETTDFDPGKSHEECAEELYAKYGKCQGAADRPSYENFAEVITSTLTEHRRDIEDGYDPAFKAPKHFGTDLLLNPIDYAAAYNATQDKRKTRRVE